MSELELEMLVQPTDETCGPTCLHSVYRYYGFDIPLDQLIDEVMMLAAGGTLGVILANDALRRGYRATIYTYNLHVFDPTWFADPDVIAQRLRDQRAAKNDPKLHVATDAYLDFLTRGGRLIFEELTPRLLRGFLTKKIPILTGLSATYLYGCSRERYDNVYDDVRGEPTGHFVVVCGYDKERNLVRVADPQRDNPRFGSQYYWVSASRVMAAVCLGIVTYDANLVIVQPPDAAPVDRIVRL